MKTFSSLLCLILTVSFFSSCATRPFFKPPGDRLGSCKCFLKPEGRSKMHVTFDFYKQSEGDVKVFLSIPSQDIRFGKVENIDFENGIVRILLSSPRRMYEGTIMKENFTIEGEIKPWINKFKIQLEK